MVDIFRRKFIKEVAVLGAGITVLPRIIMASEDTYLPAAEASNFLLNAPCLVRPTVDTITINVVADKKPIDCYIRYRKEKGETGADWRQTGSFAVEANTPVSIPIKGLTSETLYRYQVQARLKGTETYETVAGGSFPTQRVQKGSFSFAIMSDAHITPNQPDRSKILSAVSASILARKPDFFLMLGDNIHTISSHGGPMTNPETGPMLYTLLRDALDGLTASVPVFNVVGNWEGENGWHTEQERAWARGARMEWIPSPLPDTYAQGGSDRGDYYGFTWGDTLNLVLTVTGYTTIDHVYMKAIGKGDDWTLGDKQKQWVYDQLSKSKAKWKFIYIHHTVGGKAGTDIDTRYGRGGGQAAHVGEQALVHEWMQKFGVNAMFYGHDHVFTDIPVDGIHYICVGSAGAPWKFPKASTGYETFWPDSGYTWVAVTENGLAVSFIKPDTQTPEGIVLHKFEIK